MRNNGPAHGKPFSVDSFLRPRIKVIRGQLFFRITLFVVTVFYRTKNIRGYELSGVYLVIRGQLTFRTTFDSG